MKSKDELNTMLGAARFEKYFLAAERDLDKAVQLYRWNARFAGALHVQLSYFEVLTRNAIDSALKDWNEAQGGYRDWSLERQSADLLYNMLGSSLRRARRWATKTSERRPMGHERRGAPINHDDVVAQLTLGNWSNLLGEAHPDHRENAKRLWQEGLHKAFPNLGPEDESRVNIGRKFEQLVHLRNRISHQENLLEVRARRRLNDMFSVLAAIDNTLPSWVEYGRNVRQVAGEDPRKSWG